MDISKLRFFDKNGYNLNFEYNNTRECWEGNIYLPPVSVGLYSNTTVFVLEEIELPTNQDENKKHYKSEELETIYVFPRKDGSNNKITFQWDIVNDFVDEFFMFTFDEDYTPTKHSALQYSYNNGPDCEPLLITKFDTYEVLLDDTDLYNRKCKRVLPIHVAFSSPAQFDGNTFKRTLVMNYGNRTIARITYFAESVEEDERLKIWNYNLGYNIQPEDTIIFKNSGLEEPRPDYVLLNEKRKELLIEGHNIYPFVGSYKAIMGAIKFFGYDNLNLVEFWRNINPNDDNYGKLVMSPKYVLSNKENTFIKDSVITFPNSSYRKANRLAFTYTINTPTGDVDLYELPYVKEDFKFSINEIILKLMALRKKLNKEFMPSSSKIIDIIGEASYFGIQLLKNGFSFNFIKKDKDPINMSISCYPDNTINITEDRFFNDYIFDVKNESKNINSDSITILNNIGETRLEDIVNQYPLEHVSNVNDIDITEPEKSDMYKEYHKAISYTFLKTEDVIDNDTYTVENNTPEVLLSKNDEDYITKLNDGISAKVILSNTTYREKTFDDLPYPFKYIGNSFDNINILDTFVYDWEKDIFEPDVDNKVYLKWTVSYSKDQLDESYHDNQRQEYYDSLVKRYNDELSMGIENEMLKKLIETIEHKIRIDRDNLYMNDDIDDNRKNFKAIKYGELSEMNNVLFELPYVGYYDVTLTMYKHTLTRSTSHNGVCPCCGCMKCICAQDRLFEHVGEAEPYIVENTKVFKKYIKVEPQKLDIRGFYYDARPVPDKLNIEKNLDLTVASKIEMEREILKNLNYLTYLAKNDDAKLKYKKINKPGGYDLQMVLNQRLNIIDEDKHIYDIHNGPYAKENFIFGKYIIQDGEFIVDNVNKDIVNLIPSLKTARYIRNGVDVKPYTWIYLTYDYSKIVHRCNPVWTLTNKTTGKKIVYEGKYFTCLLRQEGFYNISLSLTDIYNNKYSIDRNIIVVDKKADYKLYTSFKKDYEAFKRYQIYKEDIANEERERQLGHYYNTGDYLLDFNKLKVCDYELFINDFKGFVKQLDRDKSDYNVSEKHPEHVSDEITGRLSIQSNYGLCWDFNSPWDISGFDYFQLNLEYDIPKDDELWIYFVQNIPNKYFTFRITSKDTIIPISEIAKEIDVHNISYIAFFNTNEDKKNKIEINIQNIGFEYDD